MAALVAAGLLLIVSPAHAEPADRVHLALGDSVAATFEDGYVQRYFAYMRDPGRGGVDRLVDLARSGETSQSMRASGGQLDLAVETIRRRSDIAVVTLDIGGNDALSSACQGGLTRPECAFKDNYRVILDRLAGALAADPGRERFQVMEYYNPNRGANVALEPLADFLLLGSDLRVDCSKSGDDLGLNDLIACMGNAAGAQSIETYTTFTAAGPRFLFGIHPSRPGHAAIACLFAHPDRAGHADPCGLLRLTGTRTQRVLARHSIAVTVRTSMRSAVRLSATIRIPGPATDVRLRAVVRELAPAASRTIDLRLDAADARALRRALLIHERLAARVAVRAEYAGGQSTGEVLTIRLVRSGLTPEGRQGTAGRTRPARRPSRVCAPIQRRSCRFR